MYVTNLLLCLLPSLKHEINGAINNRKIPSINEATWATDPKLYLPQLHKYTYSLGRSSHWQTEATSWPAPNRDGFIAQLVENGTGDMKVVGVQFLFFFPQSLLTLGAIQFYFHCSMFLFCVKVPVTGETWCCGWNTKCDFGSHTSWGKCARWLSVLFYLLNLPHTFNNAID